ncbi:hypothetical protein GmHk_06G016512 [Glycine max]|nr:hypothetical protein GmHk_06G016512 [Glycine max]
MNHADEEVHEQPEEETGVDVTTDAEGFPGEPHNTSVLQDYVYHVAAKVWNGEVEKFGKPAPEIEGSVATTGLSLLITCSLETGEVTITWDDVVLLLNLPITSTFHTFESLHVDDAMLLQVELLEVSAEETRAETVQCHGAYVQLS